MARPRREAFKNCLRQHRQHHGFTQQEVAERIGITVEMVRRHEQGQFPTPTYRKRYASFYGAPEASLWLREAKVTALTHFSAGHLGDSVSAEVMVSAGVGEQKSGHAVFDVSDEEDATERRDFLRLTTLAGLAAETSRQIAAADPDPLALADLEDDVDRFAVVYATTPHAVLLPQVERRWTQVDRALLGRTSLAAQERLTRAAGRLSYFISRLAFNTGEYMAARRFSVLAEQYARQVEDPIILGSVAGMIAHIAYYRQRYEEAISVFDNYPADPPYLVARNAASRARAYGKLGNVPAAKAQLDLMHRSLAERTLQPGSLPVTEAASWMFTAKTLVSCGDGRQAETFARQSIAAHESAGIGRAHQEEWMHALLALSAALLRRDHPEVDEATAVTRQVVEMVERYPTHTVIKRAGDLVGNLHEHDQSPEIADLRERLAAVSRPALTAEQR